jgi:hypothetical protein
VGHDYSGYSTDELNRQIEASIYAMNHFSDRDDIFPQEYSHLSSISDVLNILREQMAERDRRRGI